MNKIITITLILICAIVSGNASAANKKSDIYAFGFSASFNDSTVYFTDIQLVKDVTIEHKSHFLENRDLYSKQLSQHLSDQGMPARVCVIFFDAKLKNIEKQFTKLKKKYAKNGKYELKYVGANEFQFKAIESDKEQQAESPTKKTKKAKKNKKKDK